ncbi:MAG: hypothetical protein K8S87_04630, partial [Planctomycetes bacterium]|nr:hypothetical protein [Planctomycetota bacterium]
TLTTITPSNDTTFTISLQTVSKGNKTASVSIANSDLDENPYTFAITGMGTIYTEGDVNGDGLADMIVGACYNGNGGFKSGCVYIFFGKSNWNSNYDASNADVKLVGELARDEFAYSVSIAGDVNDDGFEDVVVGAHFDSDGGYKSGCAFIFFGRYNWTSVMDASDADVKLIGEDADDRFGTFVTSGGDVNNDGINDVVVGAHYDDDGGSASGCSFIFFGRTQWSSSIDASNANVKLIGENNGDHFGVSITTGDVNDDGRNDVIVGAHNNSEGGSKAGSVYLFYGRQSWSSSIDASNANVKFIGEDADDWFGQKLSSHGDVNNDGIDDIVIGAHYDDDGGDYSGCAFIFFGRTSWVSKIDASNADVKFIGEDAGDTLGVSVTSHEDINNDGIVDIVIGARMDDDGGDRSGCAFIFFGRSNWSSIIDASQSDVKLIGEETLDFFGSNVFSCKDVNSDGVSDIIIGAWGDDEGGSNTGSAYIFLGRSNWSSVIDASNSNVKIIGEEANDRFSSFRFGN